MPSCIASAGLWYDEGMYTCKTHVRTLGSEQCIRWKRREERKKGETRTPDSGGNEGGKISKYLAGGHLIVDDKRPVEVLVKEDADERVTRKVLGQVELFARVDPSWDAGRQRSDGQSSDG